MSNYNQDNLEKNIKKDLEQGHEEVQEETKRISGTDISAGAILGQNPQSSQERVRTPRSARYALQGQQENKTNPGAQEQNTPQYRQFDPRSLPNTSKSGAPQRRQQNQVIPQKRGEAVEPNQVEQQLYGQGRPQGPRGGSQRGEVPSNLNLPSQQRPVAKRRGAVPSYLQDQETMAVKKKKGPLSIVVIILLIIGFLVVGFAILPQRETGFLGALNKVKSSVVGTVNRLVGNTKNLLTNEEEIPLEVKGFIASTHTGQAPLEVGFTITTSNSVQGIRLVNSDSAVFESEATVINNEENKIWTVTVLFSEEMRGAVRVHMWDGSQWSDGGQEVVLTVGAPQAAQVWSQEGIVLPSPGNETAATVEPGGEAPVQPTINDNSNVTAQGQEDKPLPTAQVAVGEQQGVEPTNIQANEPLSLNNLEAGTNEAGLADDNLGDQGTQESGGTIEFTDDNNENNSGEIPQVQEPAQTPSPEPTAQLSATPTPMPYLAAAAVDGTNPDQINLTSRVYADTKSVENFTREKEVEMGGTDTYSRFDNGVLTFRGGPFRQNAAFGITNIEKETMSIGWSVPIGRIDNYSGVYWTGQPAIIKWPKQIREMMNINAEKIKKEALKEVVLGTQDGKIYFIDLDDGQATREAIDIGYPLRSSITIHPNSYPMLTVGQGISKLNKGTGKIGYHIYNLIDHKQLLLVNGRDDQAYGSNGAMDGTSLIDRQSDTLIFAGENGLLYTVSLKSALGLESQNFTIEPEVVKYRSKAKGQKDADTAVEGSIAVYGKYVYFADAAGILQCVDINTMTPIWAIETDDNTDATIALDFDDDGSLGLYTVNTVFKQGKKGICTIRRIDALSGQQVWSVVVDVKYDSDEVGGGMASPVVGKNSIDNMVIFTIAKTVDSDGKGGQVLALDKKTGNKVWTRDMDTFSWSSPVAVYNDQGNAWIIQGDNNGVLHMLSASTGEILSSLELEGNIKGSPAVYENTLVIGTTGKDKSYIYGITLE